MTTQNQVPDLEICQTAEEKGLKIESINFWVQGYEGSDCWVIKQTQGIPGCGFYSAPLTDEILEVLPRSIKEIKNEYILTICRPLNKEIGYRVFYMIGNIIWKDLMIEDKKLSNALLRLAIQLKSEGII